jgi:hypothetical protein
MGPIQRFRNWRYLRRTRKIYIKQLSKFTGIPIDKIKGTKLGKKESD